MRFSRAFLTLFSLIVLEVVTMRAPRACKPAFLGSVSSPYPEVGAATDVPEAPRSIIARRQGPVGGGGSCGGDDCEPPIVVSIETVTPHNWVRIERNGFAAIYVPAVSRQVATAVFEFYLHEFAPLVEDLVTLSVINEAGRSSPSVEFDFPY